MKITNKILRFIYGIILASYSQYIGIISKDKSMYFLLLVTLLTFIGIYNINKSFENEQKS